MSELVIKSMSAATFTTVTFKNFIEMTNLICFYLFVGKV